MVFGARQLQLLVCINFIIRLAKKGVLQFINVLYESGDRITRSTERSREWRKNRSEFGIAVFYESGDRITTHRSSPNHLR